MVFALLLGVVGHALGAPAPQTSSPETRARAVLDDMSPQERVGQLFLVTFLGSQAPPESQIHDLITRYHIGGVVLQREMDNFVGGPDTLESAYELILSLQEAERNASLSEQIDVHSGERFMPVYIPLFVGLSQEGDGFPNNQLLGVLSPQPSAMTLGATWEPDLAEQSGELLGSELAALGINLLLGPSLDVLESPRPESLGDIGVRSFGGDPYWVGKMGQAFVQGIHTGSQNRVAVVAKHLPGFGSSDRPLEEEVPTIRKSLDQLTQIELAPFFAVTGDAPNPDAQTDAMLMGHIRYQGFQGNIRATTRPVSFDPQAFSELMALPAFANWRTEGGVIVSDQLGTRAVRRTYDATEQVFNAPLVARDALLAGNDILYLGNFVASGDPDSYTSIINTVEFFTQKYREDLAFAQRVDESVLRILTLKFRLYRTFNFSLVRPPRSALNTVGQNTDLLFEIGRQAATLLSPGAADLTTVLPNPPHLLDQVVFISDGYDAFQCSNCAPSTVLPVQALELAAESLYGPLAGNQVAPGNLTSYSFRQLTIALDAQAGEQNLLLDALNSAEWVVFALLKHDSNRPDSFALQRLLSERADLIQGKNVIVFAFNAPYYLGATDITKITAYYALYSKQSRMADLAARLLFKEITPLGASPVSIAGTGYDLITATSPDPSRLIPLAVTRIGTTPKQESTPTQEDEQIADTPEATAIAFQAGDLLELAAGPILDRNGHTVPDNTPVNFTITITTEGTPTQRQINATTHSGVATASYSIESEGNLEISASSGSPLSVSDTRQFDVVGINPEGIALQATQTATAFQAPSPQADSGDSQTANPDESSRPQANLADWFLAVIVSLFVSLFAYQSGSSIANARWGVRWALGALIGGFLSTSYVALGLSGTAELLEIWGAWGMAILTVVGAGSGWLAAWVWRLSSQQKS